MTDHDGSDHDHTTDHVSASEQPSPSNTKHSARPGSSASDQESADFVHPVDHGDGSGTVSEGREGGNDAGSYVDSELESSSETEH
ncbi:MAG: hypothetical protein H7248_05555 [Microbacteriaceae bacterium]|nr:hypothetical protein [Microbacteriaceae bacterium]